MKRILLMLMAPMMAMTLCATSVNYTADNNTIFSNPERGFITMLEGHLTKSSPYAVKGRESTLDNKISSECMSIVLVHYYLDNFKTKGTLPNEVLNGFDEDMAVLRSKGMKAIIRFSYTNSDTGNDAAWSYAKQHISQYKSHWQANADVIFCFQAGIVGAWGEWYYTQNYGNQESTMNSSRRKVVDSLLAAVPADRCIQLRTPLFKTGYVGNTDPLTESEAYNGSAKARLGHHNDAFLYDYDNMGTYVDTATQKPYLAQETLYVPLGGETDITEANLAQQWATYEKTTAEMSRMHWTFIQSGYAETTTNMWRNNGTFDELNRKMGYRYQLVSGVYSDQVAQGGKMGVKITLKNVGYAPLYNERPAYIVLRKQTAPLTEYRIQMQADPRRWKPNGATTTINEQLTIPATVPAGTYELYLYLPDKYASIASNPRYAVRFANSGVWEAATGMNKLNATVTITGGSSPVDPPEGDAIVLPATLNKANVSAYSEDMTWYNTNYFDFGPTDAPNTDRWAEWEVELRYPGEYIVSINGAYPNGHQWQIALTEANETYTMPANYATGEVSETGEALWDLSELNAGEYTIRVQNILEWGQPKLKDIILQYNGQLPTEEQLHTLQADPQSSEQAYDVLGRPVDPATKGVVIQHGKKILNP